jgi:hypothetical protein
MKTIKIGTGAGYADDRIQHGVDLVNYGQINYIIFECLAERTIAIAQQAKLKDPKLGYNNWLDIRLEPILKKAKAKGIKIISNMGAANPQAAAEKIASIAREQRVEGLKIAAVTGDDVFEQIKQLDSVMIEDGKKVSELGIDNLIAANAYLGAEPIVEALSAGADIVITGRVADPSLFVAPIAFENNLRLDGDWTMLGKATCAGHLMECGTYVSGGFYGDPGIKDIQGFDDLGQPICEFQSDGCFVITKRPQTGGEVSIGTCSEQLLYEIHDPARYITPDVVADFSAVTMEQVGPDRVSISNATGHPRTSTLKVNVAYHDSYAVIGEFSYGGVGCVDRAKLACDAAIKRFKRLNLPITECRTDIIGYNSLFSENTYGNGALPNEVRVRVAVRTSSKDYRQRGIIANEIRSLSFNGPYGYGGPSVVAKDVIAINSVLIPRELVHTTVTMTEV